MFLNLKCWQVLQRRPRHNRTCRDQTCYFGGGEGAGGWSTWWRFWGPSHADTRLATWRVRVAGPKRGKRGQVRTEEAELAITTSFLRRTISVAGVRAQAKLLFSRLEVMGPVTGVAAAAGRRSLALNLERKVTNQRRADLLSRLQGKALLRRGHFKID